MRKVAFLAAAVTVACLAVAASAIQPPRVIELTDGSVPFGTPVWSPNGRWIAMRSIDGGYLIEAKEGAEPKRIADVQLNRFFWVSDSELVGTVIENVPGYRFRSTLKAFRITTSGRKTLIDEGPVRPSLDRTMSGKVVYDSAGVVIGVKPGQPGQVIDKSQELVLVNHFPPEWIGGKGKVHEDEDLWLESIDKQKKRRVLEGVSFLSARFSSDGSLVVGESLGQDILVVTFEGNVVAKIEPEPSRPEKGLSAWVAEPALSPDNTLWSGPDSVDTC